MNRKKPILIVIALIILVCINIILLKKYINLGKNDEDSSNSQNTVENNVVESENESNILDEVKKARLAKLKRMGEKGRMETYFYSFMTYISENEYDKAYELLYPEFKEQYFPEIESFIKYVREFYPEEAAYNYKAFERQGTIYILTVEIIDTKLMKDQEKKTQRVVIQENDFDDFVLSFQII